MATIRSIPNKIINCAMVLDVILNNLCQKVQIMQFFGVNNDFFGVETQFFDVTNAGNECYGRVKLYPSTKIFSRPLGDFARPKDGWTTR